MFARGNYWVAAYQDDSVYWLVGTYPTEAIAHAELNRWLEMAGVTR